MSLDKTASRKIDWADLRRRLETATAELADDSATALERRKTALSARARQAAQTPPPPESGAVFEIVKFSLLHETYGLEAAYVQEVAWLKRYVPIPGAPDYILGVLPLRGRMLTIVNLKPLFGLGEKGITNLNRVLVLQEGPTEFGLLVDDVSGALERIPAAAVRPAPATFSELRSEFTRGVTSEPIIVLNAARLLREPRFTAPASS